jgi:hypothetical protein
MIDPGRDADFVDGRRGDRAASRRPRGVAAVVGGGIVNGEVAA